jgi:hypothetical protein
MGADTRMAQLWQAGHFGGRSLNSDPHSISLFQNCNDSPRKVLAFILAAMSVKVRDLCPTTELNIHTALSSAITGELGRCPRMWVIYWVGTHWRLPPRLYSRY